MLPKIIVVTGTDTGVGKTITTAALAAVLGSPAGGGRTVAAYKPAQTGVLPGEPGDMAEVRRLAGPASVSEGIRLRAPMAPVAAAGLEGARLPALELHAERIRRLAASHGHVLVEGAGGLLVELDEAGRTLADLAALLGAGVVVVARSGLGTLNHTRLTLEALAARRLDVAGLVVGAFPRDPDEVQTSNVGYLRTLAAPLLGIIGEGASELAPGRFRERAGHWLPGLVRRP